MRMVSPLALFGLIMMLLPAAGNTAPVVASPKAQAQLLLVKPLSLVKLDDVYAKKGLTIVGMYHHKSEGPMVEEDVRELVLDHYKFKFPVAIDEGWKTLKSWWLTAHPDSWTSVSFVIDKKGVVRFMHLGGEYPPDSADYEQMKRWIEELLTEPA